jgi:putative heme transporter
VGEGAVVSDGTALPEGTSDPAHGLEAAPEVESFRLPPWLDHLAQVSWRLLVVLVGVAGLIMLFTRLYLVSLPIILALILATITVPPARRLERRGLPRMAAALTVVGGGSVVVIGGLVLLVPPFTRQVGALGPTLNEAFERVLVWLDEGPLGLDRAEIETLVTEALDNVGQFSGTIATQVGSIAIAVGEVLTAISLALVLLFFFVKDGEQLVGWFIARTPERLRNDLRATGARGWGALAGYVRGTAAIALIDAVGIGLGLLIVGVPLVLPLTVLVFLGGFVPVIGAFISGLLAVLVALATGGLTTALIVLAIVLVVQQIESNVLQPVIMRRAVSLHPVVILTVLTSGAVIVGVLGAFLAVPLAATAAAIGNELRLRSELRRSGADPGPSPLGGRGVDPELVLPEASPIIPRPPRRRRRPLRRRGRDGADGRADG